MHAAAAHHGKFLDTRMLDDYFTHMAIIIAVLRAARAEKRRMANASFR